MTSQIQTKITAEITKNFAEKDTIYQDPFILHINYEPDTVFHRAEEVEEINQFFKNATKGMKNNLDLIGTTGTGKTLITKRIMIEFLKRMEAKKIRAVYINGAEINTEAKIIRKITEVLVETRHIGWGMDGQLKTIENQLQPLLNCVVVLDEVDKILEKSGDSILYILSNNPKISLINISNRPGWRMLITDQRVTSRMQPHPLIFHPYSEEQLYDILKYRAEKALNPNVYDDDLIRSIAHKVGLSSGDMRKALDLLKRAADYAQLTKQQKIMNHAITFVEQRQEVDTTIECIEGLPPQKKILLMALFQLIDLRKKPTAEDIQQKYAFLVKNSATIKPLSLAVIRNYLSELMTYGFVDSVTGRGQGQGRGRAKNTYDLAIDKELFRTEIYNRLMICEKK